MRGPPRGPLNRGRLKFPMTIVSRAISLGRGHWAAVGIGEGDHRGACTPSAYWESGLYWLNSSSFPSLWAGSPPDGSDPLSLPTQDSYLCGLSVSGSGPGQRRASAVIKKRSAGGHEGRVSDAPPPPGNHLRDCMCARTETKLLYTTPSGWWWWWCVKSLFRQRAAPRSWRAPHRASHLQKAARAASPSALRGMSLATRTCAHMCTHVYTQGYRYNECVRMPLSLSLSLYIYIYI